MIQFFPSKLQESLTLLIIFQGADGKGFDRLVDLCGSQKSSVWEAALATLVNLSHLENLRPILGNAGAVAAIIEKVN
jgi:hypothetical protein